MSKDSLSFNIANASGMAVDYVLQKLNYDSEQYVKRIPDSDVREREGAEEYKESCSGVPK